MSMKYTNTILAVYSSVWLCSVRLRFALGREIIKLSDRYPLVSGFYKLMNMTFGICAKKGADFFDAEIDDTSLTVRLKILFWRNIHKQSICRSSHHV